MDTFFKTTGVRGNSVTFKERPSFFFFFFKTLRYSINSISSEGNPGNSCRLCHPHRRPSSRSDSIVQEKRREEKTRDAIERLAAEHTIPSEL